MKKYTEQELEQVFKDICGDSDYMDEATFIKTLKDLKIIPDFKEGEQVVVKVKSDKFDVGEIAILLKKNSKKWLIESSYHTGWVLESNLELMKG